MELGVCSLCGVGKPIYYRRYSGEKLCKKCFIESFIRKVRLAISKYKLFNPFDKIAVAVSGGKDSLTLLQVLEKIEREYPKSSLIAVGVDEGIPGYRDEALKIAEKFASKLGVPFHRTSFKELYGFTLKELEEKGILRKLHLHTCSVCGVLRRKALTKAAREVGATVIATAHTLDDVVQTYFLNMLRGDTRLQPVGVRREVEGVIPRAAPFRLIPQREVIFYAYLKRIPFQTTSCPHASKAMRNPIRRFLTEYDVMFPGSLYASLQAFEKTLTKTDNQPENRCIICGEPTSRRICRACEIENRIKELIRG